MIRVAKNDYINIPALYGIAVLSVIALSLSSKPLLLARHATHAPAHKEYDQEKVKPLFNKEAFTHVEIRGKAYIVYDIVNGEVLASKNETAILPLASLSKVMTAVTSRLHNERGTKVTIHQQSVDGAFDLGLKNNQVWDLDELLKYTLVFSSNDGARAIADSLGGRITFVNQMNADAHMLGLDLHFTNPAGLDEDGQIGGTGTVLDVAKLFAIARKDIPEVLDATVRTRTNVTASNGRISGIPNTNQTIMNLLGAEASKTGYTDMAGGNLGVIVDVTLGHPVAIIVLGSTHEERFKDVEKLYKALRTAVSY